MKIGEEWKYDAVEDKYIQKKTYDYDPLIEKVKQVKELNGGVIGEHRCVGIIDTSILNQWFKEAGVTWDDKEACSEIVKKKMMSGEFDKLRVWEGKY